MTNKHLKKYSASALIGEMHIKLTMIYHCTPHRMAKIENTDNQVLVRLWNNQNSPMFQVEMENNTIIFEKTLAASYKNKYIPILWTNDSMGCFPKRNENIRSQRKMYRSAYSRFIHNSPQLETTQMSNNRRMDKEIVVYTHNEALLSNKESSTTDTLNLKTSPINHKNITLSERSFPQKSTYQMMQFR